MSDDEYRGPHFDGRTYEPEFDYQRLGKQMHRVAMVMIVRPWWHTLAEISALTNDPEASISARLRDLRKERFGSHIIEARVRGDREKGQWEYRLVPRGDDEGR